MGPRTVGPSSAKIQARRNRDCDREISKIHHDVQSLMMVLAIWDQYLCITGVCGVCLEMQSCLDNDLLTITAVYCNHTFDYYLLKLPTAALCVCV